MTSQDFAARIAEAEPLSSDQLAELATFAKHLPPGWNYAQDLQAPRCVQFSCQHSDPAITLIRIRNRFTVALRTGEEGRLRIELFRARSLVEATKHVRESICDVMQTEDSNSGAPAAWLRCAYCDPEEQDRCTWLHPVENRRQSTRKHPDTHRPHGPMERYETTC
jgi:hypothetical protein